MSPSRVSVVLSLGLLAFGAASSSVVGDTEDAPSGWALAFPDASIEDPAAVFALLAAEDVGGTGPCLYAGGSFTYASHRAVHGIARYDGEQWWALGEGIEPTSPSGGVRAMANYDDGSGPALFVAGGFTSAGGVAAANIARWDGASWSALGAGLDGNAYALAVFDDGSGPALYAAGGFAIAGDVSSPAIARWNGRTWAAVAGGAASGSVGFALAVLDDGTDAALALGGVFSEVGGVGASNVARWDGATWTPLGTGTDGIVRTFEAVSEGSTPILYAGGAFGMAGGTSASHVARWDGAAWSPLGAGTDAPVVALACLDGDSGPALYAAGWFTGAGDEQATSIARWDGTAWSAVGAETIEPLIDALAVFDPGDGSGATLIAGGAFESEPSCMRSVGRWDGEAWSGLGGGLAHCGGGVDTTVAALASHPGPLGKVLVAGGPFVSAGGTAASALAAWDGAAWSAMGPVTREVGDPEVWALRSVSGGGDAALLHVGGRFDGIGGVPVANIATWDGSTWSALGAGADGWVHAIEVLDGADGASLYAGGSFTVAGNTVVNHVARWDGTEWSPIGLGVDDTVYTLATFDDGNGPALYAGGRFTAAAGNPASGIARWDGAAWSALGSGVEYDGSSSCPVVYALAVHNDGSGTALYAGGCFLRAGGIESHGVARWDGTEWSAVATPVATSVLDLAVFDDGAGGGPALFAAHEIIPGSPLSGIMRWNGAAWSALEGGLALGPLAPEHTAGAYAIAAHDNGAGPALYVAGTFDVAGGDPVENIAVWRAAAGPADLNGDGIVDGADLGLLLGAWGTCPPGGPCAADLDADGAVDAADLGLLLDAWGRR